MLWNSTRLVIMLHVEIWFHSNHQVIQELSLECLDKEWEVVSPDKEEWWCLKVLVKYQIWEEIFQWIILKFLCRIKDNKWDLLLHQMFLDNQVFSSPCQEIKVEWCNKCNKVEIRACSQVASNNNNFREFKFKFKLQMEMISFRTFLLTTCKNSMFHLNLKEE